MEKGRSEIVESMATKQAVTLCGTINVASPESTSCNLKAREIYSTDGFVLLRMFN